VSKVAATTPNCCTSRRRAPFDLWDRNKRGGIKLYVKRVFIMDDAEQLMPVYLLRQRRDRFNDLPLNVSREILQESRDIEGDPRWFDQRVLACWKTANAEVMTQEKKISTRHSGKFGQVLKEGIGEDAPTKTASPNCCASHRRTMTAMHKTYRWPITWPRQRRSGQDLLCDR
jgi:HSP90 family molecular chaperone